MENDKSILTIQAFSEPVTVEGKTYYDNHSRMYSIIRLPAVIRNLFPQFKRNKITYNVTCFPTKEALVQYVSKSSGVPVILELFHRSE